MDKAPVLAGLFRALADPIRLKLLRLLEGNELRVQELVEILGLAQPTVSRHLGVLFRSGLLRRRREGGWTFYGLDRDGPALGAGGLGQAVQHRLREGAIASEEMQRLERCLEARAARSRDFYARMAPEWDGLRAGLEIEGLHLRLLGGVLRRTLDLVDAGTGTGALLPVLVGTARRLVGVDRAPEMLALARRRIAAAELASVRLVCADIARMPLPDASVDAVCSALALHHAPSPAAVLEEFARVVRPGGAVVVSDLVEHGEEWMRSELAHAWLGFPEPQVERWCRAAGLDCLDATRLQRRRAGAARQLPDLFVLWARRPGLPEARVTNTEGS